MANSKYRLILNNRTRLICVMLAFCGLFLGIVLTRGYYDHVVAGRVTGCAISSYVDCDKVSSSTFSAIAGVPLSVLGFGYHLFLLVLFTSGVVKRFANAQATVMPTIFLITATGAVVSVALAIISLAIIRALCIYCTMLQILNIAIFIVVATSIREHRNRQKKLLRPSIRRILSGLKKPRPVFPAAAVAIAIAGGFLLMYGMPRGDFVTAKGAYAVADAEALINLHFNAEEREFNIEDSPSLGRDDLGIQVVVLGDYNCVHCRNLDSQLQLLVDDFDRRIELVYKFFPLDGDCNPFIDSARSSTSCEAATAAYLAYEQDVFWEYHNELFEHYQKYSRTHLIEYAKNVGVPDRARFENRLDDDFVKRRLYLDILEGVVAGVTSTPAVFLNGRRLETFRGPNDSQYELLLDTIAELTGQEP